MSDKQIITLTIDELAAHLCVTAGKTIGIKREDIVNWAQNNKANYLQAAEAVFESQQVKAK